MSNRVPCKFFAHGACLKGENCGFSHDQNNPTYKLCTFYQRGICSYGSHCRYEHVKASMLNSSSSSSSLVPLQSQTTDSVAVPSVSKNISSCVTALHGVPGESSSGHTRPTTQAWSLQSGQYDFLGTADVLKLDKHSICSFAATGNCPRGDKCTYIHGDLCATCGMHSFQHEEREEYMRSCEKKKRHIDSLQRSQEIECSVCLDRVLSKATPLERKFGLLMECDHPFCISCIRSWRSSSPTSGMDVNATLRACPICRKLSYFVVPSDIWYSNPEEKHEIIDNYKAKLRSIDCKHFNFGDGNCPFGSGCFYKHTVKAGSYTWKYLKPPPRQPHSSRYNVMERDEVDEAFEDFISDDEVDDWLEDLISEREVDDVFENLISEDEVSSLDDEEAITQVSSLDDEEAITQVSSLDDEEAITQLGIRMLMMEMEFESVESVE